MRVPSFSRTLSPSTQSPSPTPDYNPQRPYLPVVPDPRLKSLQKLGKALENIGERIVDRQSSMNATDLTLEFNEELAQFENNLTVDDYANWHKSVEEFSKDLVDRYESRAEELKITDDDRVKLRNKLRDDAATARLRAMRGAKNAEASVVPARIKRSMQAIVDASRQDGLGAQDTRRRVLDFTDLVERNVDVIGREQAEVFNRELLNGIEEANYDHLIETDPAVVVAGGMEQFQFTEKGRSILNAAQAELNRVRASEASIQNARARALTRSVSSLEATIKTAKSGSAEHQARLDARIELLTSQIDSHERLYGDDEAETVGILRTKLTAAVLASQAKDIIAASDRPGAKKAMDQFVESIQSADPGQEGLAAEMGQWVPFLQQFVEGRIEAIDDQKLVSQVWNNDVDPATDPKARDAMEKQFWDAPMSAEAQQLLGDEDPLNDTTTIEFAIDNMIMADPTTGTITLGPGYAMIEKVVGDTGYLPDRVYQSLRSKALSVDESPEADRERYWAIAALSRLERLGGAQVWNGYDSETRMMVENYNKSSGDFENPTTFGAYARKFLVARADPDAFNVMADKARATVNRLYGTETGEMDSSIESAIRSTVTEPWSKRIAEGVKWVFGESDEKIEPTADQMDMITSFHRQRMLEYMSQGFDESVALKMANDATGKVYAPSWYNGTRQIRRLAIDNPIWAGYGSPDTLSHQAAMLLAEQLKAHPPVNEKDIEGMFKWNDIGQDDDTREIREATGQWFGIQYEPRPEGDYVFRQVGKDIELEFLRTDPNTGKPQWLIKYRGKAMIDYDKQIPLVFEPDFAEGEPEHAMGLKRAAWTRRNVAPAFWAYEDAVNGAIDSIFESQGIVLPKRQIDTGKITPFGGEE